MSKGSNRSKGRQLAWLAHASAIGILMLAPARVADALTFVRVIEQGDVVEGQPALHSLNAPAIGNGDVVFGASVSGGGRAIFAVVDGTPRVVIGRHEIPPDATMPYSGSTTPKFDGQQAAMRISTDPLFGCCPEEDFIYAWTPAGGLRQVAAEGEVTDGGETILRLSTGDPVGVGQGLVAFAGATLSAGAIFVEHEGAVDVWVDSDTLVPGSTETFESVTRPQFGNGLLTFSGGVGASPNTKDGVFTTDGQTVSAILAPGMTLPDGSTVDFGGAWDVTGDGRHLLDVFHVGGMRSYVLADGGDLDIVLSTGDARPEGGVFEVLRSASVWGDFIAFIGEDEIGNRALYLNEGGVIERLLGPGDLFDGRTIQFVSLSREGLRDGQLAIRTQFTDGHQAIYVASVPEPRGLVGIVLLGFGLARRRTPPRVAHPN